MGGSPLENPREEWLAELEELLERQNDGKMTARQARILHAAMEIFAEKGYSGAATSEIAQRAGVAEGTIFRHYRTKKDLLLSLVAPFMARLLEPFVLRDLLAEANKPHETFESFVRAFLDNRIVFAEKHIKLIRILIQEVPFHPELREQFIDKIAKKALSRFEAVFAHFQAQGQIVAMPPLTAFRLAAASMMSYVMVRFLFVPDTGWDDESEREATIQYILRGMGFKK